MKTTQVKIKGKYTTVQVGDEDLILEYMPLSYSLWKKRSCDYIPRAICWNYKNLGNINRTAKKYGIEFVK